MNRTFYTIILSLLIYGSIEGQPSSEIAGPESVIILVGDGMGLSQLSVPYFYGEEEPVFSNFHSIGLVKTSSATHRITDSAAGSTAMFTGTKTYNGAIGVDPDTLSVPNLAEILSEKNYMTGVIATYSVTDATPAGFYAHASDRTMHREIAADLLSSGIDFFAGGGLQYFTDSTGKGPFREHNIKLNDSRLKKIKKPEPGKRYGFLLAPDYLPPMLKDRGEFLPEATEIAISYLSENENGFLLIVEGSQIDGGGHANNADYLITEMKDFERAVKVAYDFAASDGNTLVIVTADHETGGFTLGASGRNGYNADYSTIFPTFATTNHSATLVPLLAFGPGAEKFAGIYENTDIFRKILETVNAH